MRHEIQPIGLFVKTLLNEPDELPDPGAGVGHQRR
jgi:hypothetical protein